MNRSFHEVIAAADGDWLDLYYCFGVAVRRREKDFRGGWITHE